MIYILLALLLALIPVGIARHMLKISRLDAFLQDQPNYLSHQYPPKGSAAMSSRLSGLLNSHMQQVESVPRIYLASLPDTLKEEANVARKKRMFISSLLPLALRANELIIADRGRLIELRNKLLENEPIKESQEKWLRQIAKAHKEKLPKKLEAHHLDILLYKIGIIPASLVIAQAAIESAWGTSHFAQKGNALFGEWVWGKHSKGIIPAGREEGKTHKVKSFDYLLDSVRSYMRNLNRHKMYEGLRKTRAALRQNNSVITGTALAQSLENYSERGSAYIDEVVSIIEYNDLDILDHATLTKDL